jgi:hypothetical protein
MRGRDTARILCFEVLLAILVWSGDPAVGEGSESPDEPKISVLGRLDPDLIQAVTAAVRRAAQKLETPACQDVFSAFQDSNGRTMRANLVAKGQSEVLYLKWLVFVNGAEDRFCLDSQIVAGTNPGDRLVRVCGTRFKSIARTDSGYAAALVIHEELHSLGLPENPPSSDAITRKVVELCGR